MRFQSLEDVIGERLQLYVKGKSKSKVDGESTSCTTHADGTETLCNKKKPVSLQKSLI